MIYLIGGNAYKELSDTGLFSNETILKSVGKESNSILEKELKEMGIEFSKVDEVEYISKKKEEGLSLLKKQYSILSESGLSQEVILILKPELNILFD